MLEFEPSLDGGWWMVDGGWWMFHSFLLLCTYSPDGLNSVIRLTSPASISKRNNRSEKSFARNVNPLYGLNFRSGAPGASRERVPSSLRTMRNLKPVGLS